MQETSPSPTDISGRLQLNKFDWKKSGAFPAAQYCCPSQNLYKRIQQDIFMEILSSVVFQMCILLFVALAGYILAARINQSAVVGAIILGIIIGPSLLGLITYTDFVKGIAELGAIVLLFVVGLEFKIKDILRWKYGIIALIGVIVPFFGGFYLSKLFSFGFQSSLFVGTALTATSIAITANVLREMGKLRTEVAKAIIGAAVIDDVLSLLVLVFAEELVLGSVSFLTIAWIILKSILFLGLGIIIGNLFISRWIVKFDRTDFSRKFPELVFIIAMMVAFFYAMVAEMIGLSAIIGAFLAGVVLEGIVIRNSKSYREGAEYLQIIFGAIFFVSLGVLVDLRAISGTIILFLIALTVVAVLTKVIGCYIPARLQGMSSQDAKVVGFGMSPRGEVAMIIALIGLNAGYFKQDIYVSIVLMALLTTILTPIILRNWLYRQEPSLKEFKFKHVESMWK
jgi:Kef-type K+ transport system membrane component KefB